MKSKQEKAKWWYSTIKKLRIFARQIEKETGIPVSIKKTGLKSYEFYTEGEKGTHVTFADSHNEAMGVVRGFLVGVYAQQVQNKKNGE